MFDLRATNLKQKKTYRGGIYSSAVFTGNKQNAFTVQLRTEAISGTQVLLLCQEHKD